MITILVTNSNFLQATISRTIMQHSKNDVSLRFYVPEQYYVHNMRNFTATLEIVPPNQKYEILSLIPNEIQAKDGYIDYDIDISADYTMFAGDIEMSLTFTYVDSDTAKTYVRKTNKCSIPVTPTTKWNELITDNALTKLDQRLVELNLNAKIIQDCLESFNKTKSDNLVITESGELRLTSNGVEIGDGINVALPSFEDSEDDENDGIMNLDYIYQDDDETETTVVSI